jgi:hypothetical protein
MNDNILELLVEQVINDFSLDRKYFEAVERGDEELLQKMVKSHANNNGYSVEAWHGTPKGGFNKFRPGGFGPLFFFAKEKHYGDYYSSRFVDAPSPTTYHVFLKMDTPKSMENVGQQEDKMLAYRTRKEGFDSIETPNAYVVFIDDQIKLADPITTDNKKNIIPLSKRFDSSNSDIRY